MAKEKRNGWRIQFTTSQGRTEITLPNDVNESVYKETKRLTQLLAKRERFGMSLSLRDLQIIETYHSFVRKKWIERKLIDGKPNEKIPTLGVLLERYFASRADKSQAHHRRIWNYLTEYFGKDKRIDLITPAEAAGIRQYLMNERPKSKGKRGGCLSPATVNRALVSIKNLFLCAVKWNYLKESPFADVKGGSTVNKKNRHYVSVAEIQTAIDLCSNQIELQGILAFARYAGLRIPSEIRELKFSDFLYENNGDVSFDVSPLGKTGERVVPLFDELRPYFDALRSASLPDQEYVFAKYRTCTNIGELIKKRMRKTGAAVWQKFFVNCRRSCITDKLYAGWSEFDLTAVFGNTEDVRREYYYFQRKRSDVAALGRTQATGSAEHSDTARTPEKVPSEFPSFSLSFWDEFDDDTPDETAAFLLLYRQGWSYEKAHAHLVRERGMASFGRCIKSMRNKVYNYREGHLTVFQLLPEACLFAARYLWEQVKELAALPNTIESVLGGNFGRYGT